jgi:ketosteroid isomerase-like protein
MMYYLVEDPTLIIVLGIAIEIALGVALVRTGRGFLIWIMLGVLVVGLTGVIGQRFIVTERKRVVQTLDGVAAALKANDIDGVWSYLTDDAQFSRGKAREALGMIRVDDAKYSQLDVQVNELTSPWTAEVTFFGVIYFTDKNGMSPYNQYPKRFKLIMRKIGDRWLIENHEEL